MSMYINIPKAVKETRGGDEFFMHHDFHHLIKEGNG